MEQLPDAKKAVVQHLRNWSPALAGGALAWLVFLTLGETPVLRASGMSLVIVAMGMLLRRFGAALALCSCLVLAFSPAFWTQTGGAEGLEAGSLLALLALVILLAPLALLLQRRGQLLPGSLACLALFSLAFWLQQGQVGSLRITALASAWLLVLLVDLLQRSRPHPADSGQEPPGAVHAWAMYVLLALGTLNTPLFVLFVPAVFVSLTLAGTRLPRWHWLLLLGCCVFGLVGLGDRYLSSDWWLYPAAQAGQEGLVLPYLLADGWREAARWLSLLEIMRDQLTIPGGLLALIGLARLSRWYPATGTVTLLAWGSWAFFGLLYFGRDSAVLLLPLHMIGITWMTVAVRAAGDWTSRSRDRTGRYMRGLVTVLYALLPVWLLLQRLASA